MDEDSAADRSYHESRIQRSAKRRRVTHERSMSPPTSGQRQSTLTQIDFVSSTQPKRRRRSRRSKLAEHEGGEEIIDRVIGKNRKRTRGATRKPIKDTLTQAHGFTSTPMVIDASTDDEEGLLLSPRFDLAHTSPVASIRAGSVVEIPNSSAPQRDDEADNGADDQVSRPTTVTSASNALNSPRTPPTRRFANVHEIPSSQTPSTRGLSTQRTQRFRDIDRSPLEEQSPNVMHSWGRMGHDMADVKTRLQSQKRVEFAIPMSTTLVDNEGSPSPIKAASYQLSDDPYGGESLNIDTQLAEQLLGEIEEGRIPSKTLQTGPESQVTSLKMLQRAHVTRRELTRESGLRTPPDSTGVKRETHVAAEEVVIVGTPSSSVPAHHHTSPIRRDEVLDLPLSRAPRLRGKLERVTTIQDSEDDESDDYEDIADQTQNRRCEDGGEFEAYQNTYDPVNDALERDAARFNRTQQDTSTRQAHMQGRGAIEIIHVNGRSDQSDDAVPNSPNCERTAKDDGVTVDCAIHDESHRVPGSFNGKENEDEEEDVTVIDGSMKPPQVVIPASQDLLDGKTRTPSSPMQPPPSQATTVAATQSSPEAWRDAILTQSHGENCTVVPSSPIPAPQGLRSVRARQDELFVIPSSHGNASDTNLQFTTAPSSPLPLPPNWNGDFVPTNGDNDESITQQMQSLADYSLPSLPPMTWAEADLDSEL